MPLSNINQLRSPMFVFEYNAFEESHGSHLIFLVLCNFCVYGKDNGNKINLSSMKLEVCRRRSLYPRNVRGGEFLVTFNKGNRV